MPKLKSAVVCGAGGFLGHHLVKRLKDEGYWVTGVDQKAPEFSPSPADDFVFADIRDAEAWEGIPSGGVDELYQLAADMGGAGYAFTGENDADIMHNSVLINLHALRHAIEGRIGRVFYSSSACIYPDYNQTDPRRPNCTEDSAYPAHPDSEYGWEKLFSERLYLAFRRNHGLAVRIARLHNVFGPEGTWRGGREKAPAAICRKIAETPDGGQIEIWGDGEQTRSFLYVDECIEGIRRLMRSDFVGPVNIGSDEMVTIKELVKMVSAIAGKRLDVRHIDGPLGVRGRNSDNRLIREKLNWTPSKPLHEGLSKTYFWVAEQVMQTAAHAGG